MSNDPTVLNVFTSQEDNNRCIYMECKQCKSEILWRQNKMCYECEAGGENIENQEDNTKRKRKRILAEPIRTKGWISNTK